MPKSPATAKPSTPTWIDEAVAGLPALCTIAETATLLRVSTRTVARYLAARELVCVQRADRSARVLIPRAEIARYLARLVDAA